jgi:uncharacterized protein YciI
VEKIRVIVPRHVEYWKEQSLPGYAGGPFSDRSGGLIIFEAAALTEAQSLVDGDPFMMEGVLSTRWVKEWLAG